VVHEDQVNEEALVPLVEGSMRVSLGIDVRTVVRDATAMGLTDLPLHAMRGTGRDARGMMVDLGVVVVHLHEVIEEMTVGKAIDQVVGIEENPSVIGLVVGVRIEGSLIAIALVDVEVKIEENRMVIGPLEVGEAVLWKSVGTIGEVIQEVGVTIGDRNSSVRYCEPLEVEG
jgi:hypothetical protein